MNSPQDFLTEFVKTLVAADPLDRQKLVVDYAKRLEAREGEIRLDELHRVPNGANGAAGIISPAAGARTINYYDFDYYIYLRDCELKGEEPLPTYEAYVESQR